MKTLPKVVLGTLGTAVVFTLFTLGAAGVAIRTYATGVVNEIAASAGFADPVSVPLAAAVSLLFATLFVRALWRRRLVAFLLICVLALVAAGASLRWLGEDKFACENTDGSLRPSKDSLDPISRRPCMPITPVIPILQAQEKPAPRLFNPQTPEQLWEQPRSEGGVPVLLSGIGLHGQDYPALYLSRLPALDPQGAPGKHTLLRAATDADLTRVYVALKARVDEDKREAEQAAAREQSEANDARVAAAQAEAKQAEEARAEAERQLVDARVAAPPTLAEPADHTEPAATTATASAPTPAPTPSTSPAPETAPSPEVAPDEGAQSAEDVRDPCARAPCPVYVQATPARSYLPNMPPMSSMPRRIIVPVVRFVAPSPWIRAPQQRMPYPMFRPPSRRR